MFHQNNLNLNLNSIRPLTIKWAEVVGRETFKMDVSGVLKELERNFCQQPLYGFQKQILEALAEGKDALALFHTGSGYAPMSPLMDMVSLSNFSSHSSLLILFFRYYYMCVLHTNKANSISLSRIPQHCITLAYVCNCLKQNSRQLYIFFYFLPIRCRLQEFPSLFQLLLLSRFQCYV